MITFSSDTPQAQRESLPMAIPAGQAPLTLKVKLRLIWIQLDNICTWRFGMLRLRSNT